MLTYILIWVVLGLVMGFLARAILPGEQKMNIFTTMLIGVIGSFIGGYAGQELLGLDLSTVFQFSSIACALVGSLIVLIIWCLIFKRKWR